MTAVADARAGTDPHPARTRRRRIERLCRTELLLLRRFHVLTATAVVTVLWSIALRLVPADVRDIAVPLVLLTDVTALGFMFVPALLVLERAEGVEAALATTPARRTERVGVRVGLTTGLSLLMGAVIVVSAGVGQVGPRLLGVATMGVLFGLVATALVGGAGTMTVFLARAPLVAVPLVVPALAHLLGLVDSALLYGSPVTSAVDLLHGRMHWAGVAWQLACIGACAAVIGARRPGASVRPLVAGARRSRPVHPHPGVFRQRAAVRSFARTDRRTLVRDGLLVALVCSVPLVALVVRLIGAVGVDWAERRYGVPLAGHLPLVEVMLLVIHTPVIFGSLAGLLLLEDRDAGVLDAVATTRAAVGTLLAYRLAATVAITTVALGLSLALTGVGHPAGVVGHLSTAVAAGVVSVVPALAMAAWASNRVQGVAVMKMLGLPLYLPIATWFLTAPARWLFVPLPTTWAAWAAWAPNGRQAIAMALGASLVTVAVAVALCRRLLARSLA